MVPTIAATSGRVRGPGAMRDQVKRAVRQVHRAASAKARRGWRGNFQAGQVRAETDGLLALG